MLGLISVHHASVNPPYLWSHQPDQGTLVDRVKPPRGYTRINTPVGSFGHWLRHLPLKEKGAPVRIFNGTLKTNQNVHLAVFDIDVGNQDLQQCADAVIRLRSEFLFQAGRQEDICFRFTSGDKSSWVRWTKGYRPQVNGNVVKWVKKEKENPGRDNFQDYLVNLFKFAGSASLSQEMVPVAPPEKIEIGDVFIKGGFPGHAVIVVDVAENNRGEQIFLLAQSFMPAQEIHLLKNPKSNLSPWYNAQERGNLETPEWTFKRDSLMRFSEKGCP